jgi:LysR family transcriptional regulator for metE and metH
MNISLQSFRLVEAIVREGTLTRAASVLHLIQSALSHQLKELETELGVPVFYRKGKKLELSEEGIRFLQSGEKIMIELQMLEKDILQYRSGETGTIKIITQCYTAYHWLPRIIKYYKAINPGIDIHVVSAATHLPLDYLLKGDLDVAIIRNRQENPHIHYEPIFEDRLFVILSLDHPLA